MADADQSENVKMGQLFRAERGTQLGNAIWRTIQGFPPGLKEAAKEFTITTFRDAQPAVKNAELRMSESDLTALQHKADAGLPFFIQNEINDPATVPNLRPWQSRFWKEAFARWNLPDWSEPRSQQRLLQHACTGAGKSDIIAMAPFAGARDRCLVVVPSLAILEGMALSLGAPLQTVANGEAPREQALPALRARGLLSAEKPMPAVFVLPHTRLDAVIPGILQSQIVLTTAQTLKSRLGLLTQWMERENQPLFDLMVTDEAHHYPAPTWIELASRLRDASPGGHVFNELLLTATPHHHRAGNLDTDLVRDEPQLSPYNLLHGMEEPTVVKSVVFLEIQQAVRRQPDDLTKQEKRKRAGLQVLMLVGDILRKKMSGNPSIMHRALLVVKDVESALDLVKAYNDLDRAQKPQVQQGVKMVVDAYYGPRPDRAGVSQVVLNRFRLPNQPAPVHCLVQISKLAEGYDQPNISAVGVCMNINSPNKFAQFVGRAVRKVGAGNLEPALVQHKVDARDNVAHVITHSDFAQLGLWHDFTVQQPHGEFDPNAVSDEEPGDEVVDGPGAADVQEPPATHARTATCVRRRAMAPTQAKKDALLQSEQSLEYEGDGRKWYFETHAA